MHSFNRYLIFIFCICLFSFCKEDEFNEDVCTSVKPDSTLYSANQEEWEQQRDIAKWSCEGFIRNNDIWMRTYYDAQPKFDFRIGPAGVIAELRYIPYNYKALLAPAFSGSEEMDTDRVIQWTYWDFSIESFSPTLPSNEWRFNITQAGTSSKTFHPTIRVDFDGPGCRVDIYSKSNQLWKKIQNSVMTGSFMTRSRYEVDRSGAIIIRKTLLVGDTTLHGQAVSLEHSYLESWTPFLKERDFFNDLALSLSDDGSPLDYYSNCNYPQYQGFPVTELSGYATVFNLENKKNGLVAGLVYGKKNICYQSVSTCEERTDARYILNSMSWNNGVAILPGLMLSSVATGDVIDKYLVVQPYEGLNSGIHSELEYWVQNIERPRHYYKNATLNSRLSSIVNTLKSLQNSEGVKTNKLAPLISDIKPADD